MIRTDLDLLILEHFHIPDMKMNFYETEFSNGIMTGFLLTADFVVKATFQRNSFWEQYLCEEDYLIFRTMHDVIMDTEKYNGRIYL